MIAPARTSVFYEIRAPGILDRVSANARSSTAWSTGAGQKITTRARVVDVVIMVRAESDVGLQIGRAHV